MSEEQRKNSPPKLGDEDTVFAEGEDISAVYIGDTRDGRRCYQSGYAATVSMKKRVEIFKERIATIFNLGAVELKTNIKKIRIRGDKFTSQKNVYGDHLNQDGEQTVKINSLYDLADILATAQYDPSATGQEPSYANPALKQKNKENKGVKYWYKVRNEIVFDGVPYTVTFNIRDKGSEQYQYLIDFKENKTPGLSNTAVKNLLRADQMSYGDIVASTANAVNKKFSARKGETTSYTPQSLLMNADESIAIKPIQQKALKQYREIIEKLQLEGKQLEDAQQQLEAIQDREGQEAKRQQLELRRQILAIKDRMSKLREEQRQYVSI